jgi:hypothetical protein
MYGNTYGLLLSFGSRCSLDESVESLEQALDLNSTDLWIMSSLSNVLALQFEQRERMADLDSSIKYEEHVLSFRQGKVSLSTAFHNLSNRLQVRFQKTDKLYDLERAISVNEPAVQRVDGDDSVLLQMLECPSIKLLRRYMHSEIIDDLQGAIRLGR